MRPGVRVAAHARRRSHARRHHALLHPGERESAFGEEGVVGFSGVLPTALAKLLITVVRHPRGGMGLDSLRISALSSSSIRAVPRKRGDLLGLGCPGVGEGVVVFPAFPNAFSILICSQISSIVGP